MATRGKHNEMILKTKYEALKEFDKNRPNKEVAIQFNLPGSRNFKQIKSVHRGFRF